MLEYCISYQNGGTNSVTNAVIRDAAPPFTLPLAVVEDYAEQAIHWTVGEEPARFLSATVDGDAGEIVNNTVTVRAGLVAPNSGGEVCFRVVID